MMHGQKNIKLNWQYVSALPHFNRVIIRSNIIAKEGYTKYIMLRTELKQYGDEISSAIQTNVNTRCFLKPVYKTEHYKNLFWRYV